MIYHAVIITQLFSAARYSIEQQRMNETFFVSRVKTQNLCDPFQFLAQCIEGCLISIVEPSSPDGHLT